MSAASGLSRRRSFASFDNLQAMQYEEQMKNISDPKPHFLQRIFKGKYAKVKRSKSDDNLTEALNISIDDVQNKEIRDRSRTESSTSWAESEEKSKRRGAVCEKNENKREEFTKILETFMIKRNLDDYGF